MNIFIYLNSGERLSCVCSATTTVAEIKNQLNVHIDAGRGKHIYFTRPDQYERPLANNELPYTLQRQYMICLGIKESALLKEANEDYSYLFSFRLGDWELERGEEQALEPELNVLLHKQGSGIFKRWKLAYCQVLGGELVLSKNKHAVPYLRMKLFGSSIEAQSKKRFGFTVTHDMGLDTEQSVVLAARTQEESTYWLRKMLTAVRVLGNVVHLQSQKMTTIGEIASFVTALNVSRNHIQLDETQCKKMSSLDALILDANHMQNVPDCVSLLSKLESLHLSDNRLSRISNCLTTLLNLTTLVLSMNALSTVPCEIQRLVNLKILNISFNKFELFPDSILSLTKLEQLSVAGNSISKFPDEICKLANLEKLYAQRNSLSGLPDTLNQLRNLQMINASFNKITRIPFLQIPTLECCCFDHNPISSLKIHSESMYMLQVTDALMTNVDLGIDASNLVHLVLTRNKLTEISDAAFNCMANIESLILDHNELTYLPKRTFEINSLQFISAGWNHIQSLPEHASNPNLTNIRMHCNKLTHIPKAFDQFHQLRSLLLSDNPIQDVPNICLSIANVLEEVSMGHCSLTDNVWSTILTLSHLRILDLSYNASITYIPIDLNEHCPNLEIVNLSGNQIGSFDALYRLTGLQQVFLGNNLIRNVPTTVPVATISHLDLSFNNINFIPSEFSHNLETIEVHGNAILESQHKLSPSTVQTSRRRWSCGVSSLQGRRPTMEDKHLAAENLLEKGSGLFAIFDGHAGDEAASTMEQVFSGHFAKALLETHGTCACPHACTSGCLVEVMRVAFHKSNHTIGRKKFDKGGATSVVMYVTPPVDQHVKNETHASISSTVEDCTETVHVGVKLEKAKGIDICVSERVIPSVDVKKSDGCTSVSERDAIATTSVIGIESIDNESERVPEHVDKGLHVDDRIGSNDYYRNNEKVQYLVIGNVGDAEALLCKSDGSVEVLSVKHSTCRKSEELRIRSLAGGFISDGGRVVGVLATCRAVGDFKLYPYVSCVPDVCKLELTTDTEFVVLACDGLFDVMSYQEVVDLVRDVKDPSQAAGLLRNYAFSLGSADNISVMVVRFDTEQRTNIL
eukprot:CFRG2613T1